MILSLASVHGPAIWFAILTNDLRQSGPTDRNLSLSHVELYIYPKSMPPCCFQRKIAKCGLTTFLCNMIQHSLILSLSLFALELMLDFYRFFLHHDRKQASYTKCFPDWKIMSQHEFLPKILLVQFASTCRHTSIPQNEGHNPVLFSLFEISILTTWPPKTSRKIDRKSMFFWWPGTFISVGCILQTSFMLGICTCQMFDASRNANLFWAMFWC